MTSRGLRYWPILLAGFCACAGEPATDQRGASLAGLTRVARNEEADPGWQVQALHRIFRFQHLDTDSPAGRMLDAYQRGVGEWRNADGTVESISTLGLPATDWSSKKALPPCRGKEEPYVHAQEEGDGTRVGFAPLQVADDLLCSISFLVIDKSPENARAAGLDFLATQIELFGGTKPNLTTSSLIEDDTFVDLWSSKKRKRYTVTRWRQNSPVGHMTAQTYGPLLFEVLNNDPDFMFIENLKIELSPQFRKACRELCDKVLELRKAQGQGGVPECRAP